MLYLNQPLLNILTTGDRYEVDEVAQQQFVLEYVLNLLEQLADTLSLYEESDPQVTKVLTKLDRHLDNYQQYQQQQDSPVPTQVAEWMNQVLSGVELSELVQVELESVIDDYNLAVVETFGNQLDKQGQEQLDDYLVEMEDSIDDVMTAMLIYQTRTAANLSLPELFSEL